MRSCFNSKGHCSERSIDETLTKYPRTDFRKRLIQIKNKRKWFKVWGRDLATERGTLAQNKSERCWYQRNQISKKFFVRISKGAVISEETSKLTQWV